MKKSPSICFVNLSTGGTLCFGNFTTHPIPYDFSTFIREIFKILQKIWKIIRLNEKITLHVFCEPEHRGDPMDLGNFPTHPVPHKFSNKIRGIFKISWKTSKIMRL